MAVKLSTLMGVNPLDYPPAGPLPVYGVNGALLDNRYANASLGYQPTDCGDLVAGQYKTVLDVTARGVLQVFLLQRARSAAAPTGSRVGLRVTLDGEVTEAFTPVDTAYQHGLSLSPWGYSGGVGSVAFQGNYVFNTLKIEVQDLVNRVAGSSVVILPIIQYAR